MLIDLIGDTDFDMVRSLLYDKETHRRLIPKDETVNVMLVSEGGSVCGGLAIYDLLARLKNTVVINVAGICASAATIVLQAGKTRAAYPSTQFLLHYVTASTEDPDLAALAPYLDAQVGKILSSRMGEDNYKKARQLKSFDAKTALELKMIDEIL